MKTFLFILTALISTAVSAETVIVECTLLAGKRQGTEIKYQLTLEASHYVETDSLPWGKSTEGGQTPSCNTKNGSHPGYDLSVCRDDKGELYFLAQLNDFNGLDIQQTFDSNLKGAHSRIVLSSAHPSSASGAVVIAYSDCSVK
jgi:hypothetical protein